MLLSTLRCIGYIMNFISFYASLPCTLWFYLEPNVDFPLGVKLQEVLKNRVKVAAHKANSKFSTHMSTMHFFHQPNIHRFSFIYFDHFSRSRFFSRIFKSTSCSYRTFPGSTRVAQWPHESRHIVIFPLQHIFFCT